MPAEEVADALTMAGDKLERLHRVGVGDAAAFVTGRVLEAEQHPDADRLTSARSTPAATAADDRLRRAQRAAGQSGGGAARRGHARRLDARRGEAARGGVRGMILAEDEVGIGEDHAGIIVLDGDCRSGAPLAEHLPIADEVLELEITPNRPDCDGRLRRGARPARRSPPPRCRRTRRPRTASRRRRRGRGPRLGRDRGPEICLRFTARVFADVKIGPSPLWLSSG